MSGLKSLDWQGLSDFYYDNLFQKEEIRDGSCFFHCIADSFYGPYQKGTINRAQYVRQMRKELSLILPSKNQDGRVWYDTLSKGTLNEFSKNVPEFSLQNMIALLDSSDYVDNRYNEFISNVLNKDIYILDNSRKDVYMIPGDDDILYKNRESIVILYLPKKKHYDLVGVVEGNVLRTLFRPEHPLILKIRDRMRLLRHS